LPFALEHGGLGRQDCPADFGPGHAGHNTDLWFLVRLGIQELGLTQEVRQILPGHPDRFLAAFNDLAGSLAADLANDPFQLTHTGFAGIVFDDLRQHPGTEMDVPGRQAIFIPLTGL
jgi:hypothetical protein